MGTHCVIDAKGLVAFTGAIDDDVRARGEDIAKARNHVTEAVAALKAGKTPEVIAAGS